jgi:threonine dehydrogenase-like Zn-dependent dehydrogenase
VIDCSGLQITETTALKAVRATGIVVNVGVSDKSVTFDMIEFLATEKRFVASCCYTPEEYGEVIEAVGSGLTFWRR